MIKDYCSYFVERDATFIMSEDRIHQICDMISKQNPNIICLQEVDEIALKIFKTKFEKFQTFHTFHSNRKDGILIMVNANDNIDIISNEVLSI